MNICHYFPTADPLMLKWPKLSRHNLNASINDCDVIYCASVTQLARAFNDRYQSGATPPIVCYLWDLPVNWRSWCRDNEDYMANSWRDGDISAKLDLLYKCDKVISASNATKSVLDMHGIESDVLYHYYDADGLDAVRAGEKKNRIIQISRYALNKRFDLTLKAWKELQDKYKDWELLFVGFGDGSKLRDLSQELGVERFSLLENVSHNERIKLMKESKILVSPSLNEGFNLSPLEARHCGLNVVSSLIPTTAEFHATLLAFRPDSLEEYMEKISQAIESKVQLNGTADMEDLQIDAWTERFDNYMDSF
jgi:glycosyltransferase involved in cell wall biosynthesis